MKYRGSTIHPAFDVMEFLPLAILQLSWHCFRCDLTILPDFQPNEYLFETHKCQGLERWEIYAWAIREILCEHGHFKKCDMSLRNKLEYEAFMQMQPGAKEPHRILQSAEKFGQNGLEAHDPEMNFNNEVDYFGKFSHQLIEDDALIALQTRQSLRLPDTLNLVDTANSSKEFKDINDIYRS